ncbi:hypothetical protein [Streptomyces sp. NPDC050546]|uniref:hypothetical protein n=1 Tax=Streptomyces sp. NPDC050546 TaxID=3365628 RepID=UPI0037B4926F
MRRCAGHVCRAGELEEMRALFSAQSQCLRDARQDRDGRRMRAALLDAVGSGGR